MTPLKTSRLRLYLCFNGNCQCMKKVFLLDAFALIYRAHYAFVQSPRLTTTGLNTSAIFGFCNVLFELIDKEKPDFLVVAFESISPTFRSTLYPEYKAQRQAVPEDIIIAVPYIQRLLAALNIPAISLEGYEADDVIGTLSQKAAQLGHQVFMMTPDKDYAQLVNESIFLLKPATGKGRAEVYDRQAVINRYGVPPEHITDLLGLQGDASDNIPGIPKIGEKTALQLIEQFGSLEQLIEHVDHVSKKSIQESVRQFAEQGRLSKQLATIVTDLPLEFDEERFCLQTANNEAVTALFKELEFKTLLSRFQQQARSNAALSLFDVPSEAMPAAYKDDLQQLTDVPHEYHIAETDEALNELVAYLTKHQRFAFDTETTALDANQAELVAMTFSAEPHIAYFVPMPPDKSEALRRLAFFAPLFAQPNTQIIGQNIKYDALVLRNYGVVVQAQLFDTMIAHYLVHANTKHKLDNLAEQYFSYRMISYKELVQGPTPRTERLLRDVPLQELVDYACEDADVTFRLVDPIQAEVNQLELTSLLTQVEMPLIPVLTEMEYNGIRIDIPFLNDFSLELEKRIELLQQQIYQLSGTTFNINSPKQLGVILFEELKLAEGKKTKTGQYSTDESVLQDLADQGHELPIQLLAYRQLSKLKSTYVDAIPQLLNPKTGRVHSQFNQAVAITGRLSSSNPNLQNIPIRADEGREIRKAFIPLDANHVLLAADYSQIELRIMAALSQDVNMMAAFSQHADIHTETAAKIYHVDPAGVSSDMRRKAKMVNFGIIYGMTAFGLAQRLSIGRTEAKSIIDQYFQLYPQVKAYMEASIEKARTNGFATTIMGRRHYLRDIHSNNATIRQFAERNAINTPIQGSAADMIKLAMIRVHRLLTEQQLQTKMILQVHDELLFDVPLNELDSVKPLIEEAMVNAMPIGVPIEVNIGTGANWLDAH
jgi:DNA polymerase I